MAYQVDQILDMVDKDDHETLEEALQIQEGKDQVTLFIWYPIWCKLPPIAGSGNQSSL